MTRNALPRRKPIHSLRYVVRCLPLRYTRVFTLDSLVCPIVSGEIESTSSEELPVTTVARVHPSAADSNCTATYRRDHAHE